MAWRLRTRWRLHMAWRLQIRLRADAKLSPRRVGRWHRSVVQHALIAYRSRAEPAAIMNAAINRRVYDRVGAKDRPE